MTNYGEREEKKAGSNAIVDRVKEKSWSVYDERQRRGYRPGGGGGGGVEQL